MANHALPTTASTYANFVTELQGRIDDAVKENSTTNVTLSNPPTNLVRWNATNFYWEINTGTPAAPVWGNRSTRYDININGTVGATTANTGAFTTLSTSGVASLGASSTVGGVLITTASNTQTLTNKTLTSPVFSTIVNTGTLTLPTSTDTLVGRATTDTLTNKTLTSPKFSTGTSLLDANGVVLINFPTAVTSAVNYIQVSNTVTAVDPFIQAAGTDANIGLDLKTKGTGVVEANGVPVVTTTGTQTLTNKTLTTPVIASISNSGTVTIPTGTDTLVNLAGTQSLSNKTLTASAFNGTVGATTASTGAFTTLTASTSLNVTGTATATTFSGAGTSLTGTAASLSIGGNAATASAVSMSAGRTDATAYPIAWATSGTTSQLYSCAAVTITSSTGAVNATVFNGAGTGLTGTAASFNIGGNAATATNATNATTAAACTGNAATVTNGVYTTGNQTIGGTKTFSSTINSDTGFSTTAYLTNARNRIWSFANADGYGLSYFQGTSGASGADSIGIHFGTATNAASQFVFATAGNFTAAGSVTAYSDLRLKKDLVQIESALDKVKQLTGYTYTRIDTGERQTGLVAQDVQKVLPEAVLAGEHLSLAYGNLVGLLVEAIKELNEKVDALK